MGATGSRAYLSLMQGPIQVRGTCERAICMHVCSFTYLRTHTHTHTHTHRDNHTRARGHLRTWVSIFSTAWPLDTPWGLISTADEPPTISTGLLDSTPSKWSSSSLACRQVEVEQLGFEIKAQYLDTRRRVTCVHVCAGVCARALVCW